MQYNKILNHVRDTRIINFERCVKKLRITEDERNIIIDTVASDPQAGEEIPGTGGARKIRFAAHHKQRGKRGGYRVITFYNGVDIPVFLLSAYSKDQKEDFTQNERNTLKVVLSKLAASYRKGIVKKDEITR